MLSFKSRARLEINVTQFTWYSTQSNGCFNFYGHDGFDKGNGCRSANWPTGVLQSILYSFGSGWLVKCSR